MSDENLAPVKEGEVLAGKYRVEKVLGVGGMGVVVAARHLQLDERVALKFLLPTMLYKKEVVERFAREARAAARIKSEHVARVFDVGELESGSPYMVMEFLEGQDLADVLEKRGPLPVSEAVAFLLQACDALAEAHAAGIVHRDLKPANLFLAKRPDKTSIVKVLDFGISKANVPAGEGQLTRTQGILGTPYYMSPEQLTAAKTVDPRSDVWALGVILYELLTGRRPFDGETMPELIAAILQTVPPPLSQLRPDAPEAVVEIVTQCLAKDRESRFGSVAALANALSPAAPEEALRLVARISRVLGKEPVPTSSRSSSAEFLPSALPSAPAESARASAPTAPIAETPPRSAVAASGLGNTNARSAWGATQPEDAPRPPVTPVPKALLVAGGVVVFAVFAFVGIRLASPSGSTSPAETLASTQAPAQSESLPSSAAAPRATAAPPTETTPKPLPALTPFDAGLEATPQSRRDAGAPGASLPAAGGAATGGGARITTAKPRASAAVAAASEPQPAAQPAAQPAPAQPAPEPTNKMKMEFK